MALTRTSDYMCSMYQLTKWMLTREVGKSHPKLDLDNIPDVTGKVVVITGGTRGIGASIVKKLLQVGMRIVIGCRDPKDGQKLVDQIRADGVTTGSADFLPLDLTTLASVREFADSVLAMNLKIHLLINNAGVMGIPMKLTPDGHETQFQVNYLSHFLLTNLLLPNMMDAAASNPDGQPGRVVNVNAAAMYYGKVDFDDLELQKRYSPFVAYFNSKLYQVLMTRHLDSRLMHQHNGAPPVRIHAVHPGVVATDLVSHMTGTGGFMKGIMTRALMTPDQGADDVLHVALSAEAGREGGEFWVHRRVENRVSEYYDPKIQRQLWDVTATMVGLVERGTSGHQK